MRGGSEIPKFVVDPPNVHAPVPVPQFSDGVKTTVLYAPGQVNMSFNDTVDTSALSQPEWSDVTNVRTDSGVIQVRFGPSIIMEGSGLNTLANRVADVASSRFCGGIYHDRTGIAVLAFCGVSTTRLLWYSPSNDGWYEATATSGDYGNTRFGVAGHQVHFAIVHENHFLGTIPFSSLSDHDYLVAQIGQTAEYPIVFPLVDDLAIVGGAARHKPIIAPDPARSTFQAVPWATFNVSSGGLTYVIDATYTLSGQTTTNSAKYWTATFLSGSAVAGNASAVYGFSGVEAHQASQLHIVFNSNYGVGVWQNLKVHIRKTSGASWKLIYDPTSSDPALREPPVFASAGTFDDAASTVPGAGDPCWLAAFNLVNSDIVAGDSFDGIKLTWVSATAPPVNVVVNAFLIGFASGRCGGCEFAVSYFNSRSRAESQGVVCRYLPTTDLGAIGGARALGVTYPVSPSCVYSFRVSTNQPATSSLSYGDDYILTYCKPYGEFDFQLVAGVDHMELQVPSGGSWTYPTGMSSPDITNPTADSVRSRFVNDEGLVSRVCPVWQHSPIPIGTCMTRVNNRLFVGNVRWDSYNTVGRGVAVSDANNPFRFSIQTRLYENGYVDPASPGYLALSGEQPQSFAAMAGGWNNSDAVLVLTDKSLWACGGGDIRGISRPERVSAHGTRSPMSLASYQNMVMWLDNDLQVRTYGGRAGSLSKRRVESSLKAIPAAQIANVQGFMTNDRYYLAFAGPSQTENRNVLIWDFRTQAWSLDTRTSDGSPCGFITLAESGVDKFAFCTQDGVLNEYESDGVTDDFGTDIEVVLTPPMIQVNLWKTIMVGRVGLFMDKAAGKSLTISRLLKYASSDPAPTTIALDGDSDHDCVWHWDDVDITPDPPSGVGTVPGAMDAGVQVKINGHLPGGTKIYTIVAQVQSQETGATINE